MPLKEVDKPKVEPEITYECKYCHNPADRVEYTNIVQCRLKPEHRYPL